MRRRTHSRHVRPHPERAIAGAARAVLAGTLLLALHAAAHEADAPRAPGYAPLAYTVPRPGSYELPALGEAEDGPVVDTEGHPSRLFDAFTDHAVVLSFIYTHCEDANGCPLANFVLREASRRAAEDPVLRTAVRFVSVSFDPRRDTPAALAAFASTLKPPVADWRFYTSPDPAALAPLLAAYGQNLVPEAGGAQIAHVLRVFLIDRDRRIRNIYSASFLHADILLADVRTVLKPDAPARREPAAAALPLGPGDDKADYGSPAYRTRSQAIDARRGEPMDLLAHLQAPALGLSKPAQAAPTAAQIALGRRLFYDRRLSHNDTLSCAMCHIPEQGFTSNEASTPVGIEGRAVRRNAPTLLNVAHLGRLFHDARERSLEHQIWGPLLAANEMGNPAVGVVLDKLETLPGYREDFALAFPGRGLGMETLGAALAAYERTLIAADSPFDRWHYGHEDGALGAAARRGYALFTGKAGCSACHRVGAHEALFTDEDLHNTGIGYARAMAKPQSTREVLLAPGTRLAVTTQASQPEANDLGRYEITQDPVDRWRYRTPSLRNVALTAPYMHDGSLPDLPAVIAFYNAGGIPNEGLDPLLHPLGLNASEQQDLVEFLRSLTGRDVPALVRDAFAAPIGDR